MVRTVSQMSSEITPSSSAISIARIGRKRQASTSPQPTPMGVITSNIGFAIFMRSEDIPRQVLVLGQIAEMLVDVADIDLDGRPAVFRGIERHPLQQALHHRVHASRADVLGLLAHAE